MASSESDNEPLDSNQDFFELLSKRSLLELLPEPTLIQEWLERYPPAHLAEGELIVQAGRPADQLIIVTEGEAVLFVSEENSKTALAGTLKPGRAFNLFSVIRGIPFQYSLQAGKNCSLIKLPWNLVYPQISLLSGFDTYLRRMTENPLFRRLSEEINEVGCSVRFRIQLIGSLEQTAVPPQTWLSKEGVPPDTAFIIAAGSGHACRRDEQSKVSSIWPVPLLAWQNWIPCHQRGAAEFSIRSATRMEIFTLSNAQQNLLSSNFPEDFQKYSDWTDKSVLRPDTESEEEVSKAAQFEMTPLPSRKTLGRRRYPFVRQNDEMDCSAACMTMISKFYKHDLPIQFWRQCLPINQEGVALFDLAKVAETKGFATLSIGVDNLADLDVQYLPAIALRKFHYLVVYRIDGDNILVGDPAVGLRKMKRAEFLEGFEEAMLLLRPTPEFFEHSVPKSQYAHYLTLLKGVERELLYVWICSILLVVLNIFPPLMSQVIFDEVIPKRDLTLLFGLACISAVIAATQGLLRFVKTYYSAYLSAKVDFAAKSAFLRKLFSLPYNFFANRHVGDFTRRVQEVERIRDFMTGTGLNVALDILTMALYALVLAFYSGWILSISLAMAASFVLISMLTTPRIQAQYNEVFKHRSEQESLMSDCIKGISAIKSLDAEVAYRWRIEEKIVNTLKARQYSSALSSLLGNGSAVFQSIARMAMMCTTAYLAIKGSLSPGQVISASILSANVIGPFQRLADSWVILQESRVVADRLNDVFLTQSDTSSRVTGKFQKQRLRGEIEFRDVWFRYGGDTGDWALKGISFKIEAGKSVAIVGPSGCGKSTVSQLLGLLYHPTRGQILLDGREVREYDPAWLRTQVGFLLQESHLFYGTIGENIACTTPIVDERKADDMASLVNARDFIRTKPNQYQHFIQHGGIGLSGGEKQRVALARTLYRDPSLLILDEATSALDGISERIIIDSIRKLPGPPTVVNIAHRYTTAAASDLVILMHQGQVVRYGAHEDLKRTEKLYCELFGFPTPVARKAAA